MDDNLSAAMAEAEQNYRAALAEDATRYLGAITQDQQRHAAESFAEGFWEVIAIDSGGARTVAQEQNYDEALAELGDEIAHQDLTPFDRCGALEHIEQFEDRQPIGDWQVGDRTYIVRQVSAAEVELEQAYIRARMQNEGHGYGY